MIHSIGMNNRNVAAGATAKAPAGRAVSNNLHDVQKLQQELQEIKEQVIILNSFNVFPKSNHF